MAQRGAPLLPFAALALAACSSALPSAQPDAAQALDASASDTGVMACATTPTYAELQAAVFQPRCAGGRCHNNDPVMPGPGGAHPALDLSSTSTRIDVVGVPSTSAHGLVLVTPGDPSASFLMRKLTNDLPDTGELGSPMPTGEAIRWQQIPDAELELVRCWIAGGAP
jgi:hypothetical protein